MNLDNLKHHREGVPPITFTELEPVICPECLLPVYVSLDLTQWACIDPKCRYA